VENTENFKNTKVRRESPVTHDVRVIQQTENKKIFVEILLSQGKNSEFFFVYKYYEKTELRVGERKTLNPQISSSEENRKGANSGLIRS
jgi:hypothetical protein